MFISLFKSEKPHQNTSNIILHKTVNRNYESLMYNKKKKPFSISMPNCCIYQNNSDISNNKCNEKLSSLTTNRIFSKAK